MFYQIVGALNETRIPIISQLGEIGLWLQAIGVVTILTVIFGFLAYYLNKKRLRELGEIRTDMKRIEGKINKILENTK